MASIYCLTKTIKNNTKTSFTRNNAKCNYRLNDYKVIVDAILRSAVIICHFVCLSKTRYQNKYQNIFIFAVEPFSHFLVSPIFIGMLIIFIGMLISFCFSYKQLKEFIESRTINYENEAFSLQKLSSQ